MKRENYPKIFQIDRSRTGVQNILFRQTPELYINLLANFDPEKDDLRAHLLEHRQYYNNQRVKDDDIVLTEDFINELVKDYKSYAKFLSALTIQEVAEHLEYDHKIFIPEDLFDYFNDKIGINLYDTEFNEFIDNTEFHTAKLDGYLFVKLDKHVAFAIDYQSNLIAINERVTNLFLETITELQTRKFYKLVADNESNAEKHRFPRFIESETGDHVCTAPCVFRPETDHDTDKIRYIKLGEKNE